MKITALNKSALFVFSKRKLQKTGIMVKRLFGIVATFILGIALVISCGHNVDVVDSGTYKGTIKEVKPEEKEIYLETESDKTLELYFTDSTKLTKGGAAVDFSALKKNAKVEVTIEKMGKKLNPLKVKIK